MRTCTGGLSVFSVASESSAGIQERRISPRIGAAGPVLVMSSFWSLGSMHLSWRRVYGQIISGVILDRALADEIFSHAKKELPNEACGILGGDNRQAVKFFPATNAEHSPTRYVVDPQDQL